MEKYIMLNIPKQEMKFIYTICVVDETMSNNKANYFKHIDSFDWKNSIPELLESVKELKNREDHIYLIKARYFDFIEVGENHRYGRSVYDLPMNYDEVVETLQNFVEDGDGNGIEYDFRTNDIAINNLQRLESKTNRFSYHSFKNDIELADFQLSQDLYNEFTLYKNHVSQQYEINDKNEFWFKHVFSEEALTPEQQEQELIELENAFKKHYKLAS